MKKFFKVLFASLFLSCCLFGSIYASAVTFSCKAISSAIISDVQEAERRGANDGRMDCRNHSKNRSNPYAPGTPEHKAYEEAYMKAWSNACKHTR